jgi:hypothetical protein
MDSQQFRKTTNRETGADSSGVSAGKEKESAEPRMLAATRHVAESPDRIELIDGDETRILPMRWSSVRFGRCIGGNRMRENNGPKKLN